MLEDAHFKARDAIIDVADKHIGSMKMQNTFPKFSRTPGNVRWTGPDHGEHNEEVYKDLLGTDGRSDRRLQRKGHHLIAMRIQKERHNG